MHPHAARRNVSLPKKAHGSLYLPKKVASGLEKEKSPNFEREDFFWIMRRVLKGLKKEMRKDNN